MEKRISENTESTFEWTIPRLSAILEKKVDSLQSPVYKFCDGPWTLTIFRQRNFIRCNFKPAGDFETHIQIAVVRKSVHINGGDISFHLPEETIQPHKFLVNHKRSSFPWVHVGRTDSMKITGKIRCIECKVKVFNKLNAASSKRKYSEDDGKGLSSNKKLHHPSDVYKPQEEFINWFTSGKMCDVTIMVKGQEFRAHKDILRERSPVFFSKFCHNMVEENSGIIHITDYEPEAFQHFLAYLYFRDLKNVSEETVFDVYSIGDNYGMEEIKKFCVSFMGKHLTVNAFCEIVTFALRYKESTLLETALEFFVENFRKITTTDQWKSFLTEHTKTGNDLHILATYHSTTSRMRLIANTHPGQRLNILL